MNTKKELLKKNSGRSEDLYQHRTCKHHYYYCCCCFIHKRFLLQNFKLENEKVRHLNLVNMI